MVFFLERVENIVEQERQIVARLTPSCNHPRNFIAIANTVLEICTAQNSSMKINKGQLLKIKRAGVRVDEIYSPTKFHNHSWYSFGDTHWTKFKYESKQRAITKKISKQELQFMCTALPLDEIYPSTKFHNHS